MPLPRACASSTCHYALLLFKREGDCLAAKLGPGNRAFGRPPRADCRRRRNDGRVSDRLLFIEELIDIAIDGRDAA
jgi:hypothetical protein